uniref:Uncharacterized protein n=1 Tax=Anguilla anguilla TaxID=7936 RepID=A0A0E9RS33_ANGAN
MIASVCWVCHLTRKFKQGIFTVFSHVTATMRGTGKKCSSMDD